MWVNYQESVGTVQTFVAQNGITHPVLLDTSGLVYQAYQLDGNISPFPLDYIIDRSGTIAYGATDYDPLAMQMTIEWLLVHPVEPNGNANTVLPTSLTLRVAPNPFNSTAEISFELPRTATGQLALFDVTGRQVWNVSEGIMDAGMHRATLNGGSLASGVYFIRLSALGVTKQQKILLLR